MHQKQPPAKIAVSTAAPGVALAEETAGIVRSAESALSERAFDSLEPQLTIASDSANGTRINRICQPLNAGSFSLAGTNWRAIPLLQYLLPVGSGPSLKMCP